LPWKKLNYCGHDLLILLTMLTEEQLLVTRHIRGHARVTAVAGAGKTTTMVRYVLERLRSGMDPRLVRAGGDV
jgi:superfamily I DNA/RNA helicase